jgi:hypothetical protein
MPYKKSLVPNAGRFGLDLGESILSAPGDPHRGNWAALAEGTKDDELVVVGPAEGQIIKAARRNPIGSIEGAHVGPAQGSVVGDHQFDVPIAENEIPENAVGLLAAREETHVRGTNLESLRGLRLFLWGIC